MFHLSRNTSDDQVKAQSDSARTTEEAASPECAVDPYRLTDPASSKARSFGAKVAMAALCACCAVALAFAGYFAWDTLRSPDINSYADQTIELVGLTDDGSSINISVSQLAQFHCVRQTVAGTGMGTNGESKAGTVSIYGPELGTVLEYFGYYKSDFRRIRFTCKDDYKVTLRGDSLSYDIYLSIASGKDALYEKQQPLRVVIPDEQSGKWGYGVVKIEFIK